MALETVVAIATVVALETLVDGWTNIEAERFRGYLSVPHSWNRTAFDRLEWLERRSTVAAHDGMKDLVFAVCVHFFA